MAAKTPQLSALRMSPAEMSTIDWRISLGRNFNDGLACIARSMIVFAIGLKLNQFGLKERYMM